ncbi:MAG: thioredoxin domain-containing protein [Alkalispirochaeta sp.]
MNGSDHSRWERNNLDAALSPYLRQHATNPVWWQEWNRETLAYAETAGKPLFVSVGYATCHWCHVMAAEAFSDNGVARYLNEHFVSIKIDREERPDIDHYLMQYLLATRGNGGWPLNAFLAEPKKPVLAVTYVPVEPRREMPGFGEICRRVVEFIEHRKDELKEVTWRGGSPSMEPVAPGASIRRETLHRAANLVRRHDDQHGGFGIGAKFPPHATLLFLLHAAELAESADAGADSPGDIGATGDSGGDETSSAAAIDRVIRQTLDAMSNRGLHDHLQGGFYRYCVDRSWTIPHFEKMLYDQAMLLWVYATAWHRYRDERYRETAEGIVRALTETFADGALFVSAHDADTDHDEGGTYLWPDDSDTVAEVAPFFEIEPGGNFEGQHHLVRRHRGPRSVEEREVAERLLDERRTRRQPEVDRKIVTAWNALTGVALVVAGRYLDRPDWRGRAVALREELLKRNGRLVDGTLRLARSSLDGRIGRESAFLEDYAACLLLETFLREETGTGAAATAATDAATAPAPAGAAATAATDVVSIDHLQEGVLQFYRTEEGWLMAISGDFDTVPADEFDSPSPSPIALAELALLRTAQITGTPVPIPGIDGGALRPGREQVRDFHNIAALFSAGEYHVLHRSTLLPWGITPIATMQVPADHEDWCYRGACRAGEPEWYRRHSSTR